MTRQQKRKKQAMFEAAESQIDQGFRKLSSEKHENEAKDPALFSAIIALFLVIFPE
jgi:hypothetical protein